MSGDLTLAAAMLPADYARPKKVVTMVQARMTSTRLPGKVLAPVMGRPLLAYMIERLHRIRLHDGIVVATTTNRDDDSIAKLAWSMGCEVFRGSEHDVLGRFIGAVQMTGADIIHRIGADDPLFDPAVSDAGIALMLAGGYDWINSYSWPLGMNPQVFTRAALMASDETTDPDEREHVEPYWQRRPSQFRHGVVPAPFEQYHRRITLDTPEDLEFHRVVLEALYPKNPRFTIHDVLAFLDAHPEVEAINRGVEQYFWDRTPVDGSAPEIIRGWS